MPKNFNCCCGDTERVSEFVLSECEKYEVSSLVNARCKHYEECDRYHNLTPSQQKLEAAQKRESRRLAEECKKEENNSLENEQKSMREEYEYKLKHNLIQNNLPFGLTKKLLHHLVYIPFVQGIVRIRMYGNEKHNGPDTWWKLTKDELYNKMRRHLDEWYMGEIDPETHDSHMLHLSCNAMFAYLKNFEGLDYLKKILEKFKI